MSNDIHNPFSKGDWLLWQTSQHTKRGEVIESRGPGIVVRWLDGKEQVFPVVEGYVPPYGGLEARMIHIDRPKEATKLTRERNQGVMSVARAASALGTTPKRVRAMLREGQLKGVQTDGKWTSVEL